MQFFSQGEDEEMAAGSWFSRIPYLSRFEDEIKIDSYGMYKGGLGRDKFIIPEEYEGREKGMKILIEDFNYEDEQDFLELSNIRSLNSMKDILLEDMLYSNKDSV